MTAHRWPRCPGCDAVTQPMHGTEHRPGCAHTDDDPSSWHDPEEVTPC